MSSQADWIHSDLSEVFTRLTLRNSPPPPIIYRTHFQKRTRPPLPTTNFRGRNVTSHLHRRSSSTDFSFSSEFPNSSSRSLKYQLLQQPEFRDFEEELGPLITPHESPGIDFKLEMDNRGVPIDIRVEIVSYIIFDYIDYINALLENYGEVGYLLTTSPKKITCLTFSDNVSKFSEVMVFLRLFRGVNSLTMPKNRIPNDALETQRLFRDIANLKRLKFLDISLSVGVSNREKYAVDELIQNLTSKKILEYLNCTGYTVANEISSIQECTQLQHLNLAGCNLNDQDLVYVATLVNLAFLNISFNENITDEGLRHIKNSELTHLNISGLKITDGGLSVVDNLQNIKELLLSECFRISSAALVIIGRVSTLELLDVHGCKTIRGIDLHHLNACKKLAYLNLSNCHHVSTGNFKSVDLPNLCYLDISSCMDITTSLDILHKFSNLRKLVINNSSVRESEIKEIENSIPGLVVGAVDTRYKTTLMRNHGITSLTKKLVRL